MNNKINITKTIEKYGYDPNFLKPNSCKIVFWNCMSCFCEQEKQFRSALKNNLCLNCSNKVNSRKNVEIRKEKIKKFYDENIHHGKGKKRPEHVIQALKKANEGKKASEKTKQLLSSQRKGSKNSFFGKKHSEETIEKLREIGRKNSKKGKDSHFYGKIYHPKKIKFLYENKIFYFKSTWELKVANYFISKNINFLYEEKFFEMIIDNKETTYTPDFYLPDINLFIEVKGYWRDDAIIKFNNFCETYKDIYNIEVWNKEILKNKKIL